MQHQPDDLNDVKAVVVETLGIEDRADALDAATPLFGSLPELDSMARARARARSSSASTSRSTARSSAPRCSRRSAA